MSLTLDEKIAARRAKIEAALARVIQAQQRRDQYRVAYRNEQNALAKVREIERRCAERAASDQELREWAIANERHDIIRKLDIKAKRQAKAVKVREGKGRNVTSATFKRQLRGDQDAMAEHYRAKAAPVPVT